MQRGAILAVAGLLALVLASAHTQAAVPDLENTLYADLEGGRVVIQMRPDLAPTHVARLKHLARGGFYDGMVFHRVIEGFMAQTGDPTGTGTSGSGRKLAAEFTRTPQVRGTVSMARSSNKDSADSQWFIVLADSREALDGKYTVWGQVVSGMEFVDKIRKGDSRRDGKVSNPDRILKLQVAADAEQPPLDNGADAATVQNFSGAEFRCLALGNRAGSTAQAALAKLWVHGYLAGTYKAQNKLTFAESAADTAAFDICNPNPELFLLTALSQPGAKAVRDLPAVTGAFAAASFSCTDYTTARTASTSQADLADLWAFAFIQGYKNFAQPDMEISFDARTKLLGAVAGACSKNADMAFVDLIALVADKVKLK